MYSREKLDEIGALWSLRNNLVHEIIKEKLNEETIISKIHEMHDLIKIIYKESSFVRAFLNKVYKLGFEIEKSFPQGSEET